jgi:hypothetical protein
MQAISINWWATLAAVASNFVIGGVWYSPALFVNSWLEMSGVAKSDFNSGLPKALVGDLFSSVAMALVLDLVLRSTGTADLGHGLFVAFLMWLGFVAATLLGSVTYEHRPIKYFAINAGYRLVAMMSMGAILTLWR